MSEFEHSPIDEKKEAILHEIAQEYNDLADGFFQVANVDRRLPKNVDGFGENNALKIAGKFHDLANRIREGDIDYAITQLENGIAELNEIIKRQGGLEPVLLPGEESYRQTRNRLIRQLSILKSDPHS